MKASVLNGYNIVGDGTPAALIPILTSKHEQELPNVLKGTINASHVDEVYPFVWRNFERELNYATLYNEDWPKVGVFQYRMIGFKQPPTTHVSVPGPILVASNISLKLQRLLVNRLRETFDRP